MTSLTFGQPFVLVCAAVVATLAVARMTRLVVDDEFPPVVWLRQWYAGHVPDAWVGLVECPWCVSPYIATVDVVWAWTTGLHWTWWIANTIAALSWLAAYLCLRDIPEDQR